MGDISGKRILIIGATGTIGRVIAEVFDSNQARLFLHGLKNKLAMDDLKSRLKHVEGIVFGDISVENEVARIFHTVSDSWNGCLDAIVLCAAINPTAIRIRDLDVKDWERTIAVNLTGTFLCIKHGIPLLVNSNGGKIVILSSIFGIESPANRGAYGTSKHGITALVQTVSKEEGGPKTNIQINAICGGPAWGPIVYDIFKKHAESRGINVEDYVKERLSKIPAGRFMEARDVALLAMFLCSKDSDYINGQLIKLTGGSIE